MAKAEVKEVTTKALVLELNDRDVEVITSALRLVRDFGDVSDWDDADALRAQILSAVNV